MTNVGDMTMDELRHFGIKGMKWGVRRTDAQLGNSGSTKTKKVSRKENRRMNSEAKSKFYADKAESLYNESKKKGDRVLIEIRTPGDYAKTVVTGKEFAKHLENGGVFDIREAEVFARQRKAGEQFVLNEDRIGVYKKQNFRKPKG